MPVPAPRDPGAARDILTGWLGDPARLPGARITDLRTPEFTGFSSEILMADVEHGGGAEALAVRVAPSHYQVFPETRFVEQYRLMRILDSGTDIPVPPVLWYESDPGYLGAPFIVMRRIDGRVPPDVPPYHTDGWVTEIGPAEREAMWWSGLDILARLHRLDVTALQLGFLDQPRWGRLGLDQRLGYYEHYMNWAYPGPKPTATRALAWLKVHQPGEPNAPVLLWGDARIGNMIFAPGGTPAAVLDWETATFGQAEEDLAWYLFLDRHHSEGMDVPRLDGFPSPAETISRYCDLLGRPMLHMDYYEVLSGFKFTVIMSRIAQAMIEWGWMDADSDFPYNNNCSRLVDAILEGLPLTLSPLDDYPVHQIPEVMRHVGTSDRNFYDRYYFNAFPLTGDTMLIVGLGQYPNLGVTDAFALLRRGSAHRVVRASRELGADRMNTRVGPFGVEVLEGLKRLRVVLSPNEHGLSFDLTWDGTIPPQVEPQHFIRSQERVVFDSKRMAQTGRWAGSITVDGETLEVTPDRWWGIRDRSWGIRPVGEPEPPGIQSRGGGTFYWLYAPVQFEDHAILCIIQEDGAGRRLVEEAVRVWPDGASEYLGRPSYAPAYAEGTRDVVSARIGFSPPGGKPFDMEATLLLPVHLMVGTGYGLEPDWRHGMYQGPDLVVQGVGYDVSRPEDAARMWGMVNAVGRFTYDGHTGYGLYEYWALGDHPSFR